MKTLSDAFNSIAVKKGEYFAVELKGNPSTGYLWETKILSGNASFVKRESTSDSKAPMMVGGSVTERVIFQANETGTIEIEANHRRPWDKAAPPAQSKRFKVDVS